MSEKERQRGEAAARILIVEDGKFVAGRLEHALTELGYDVLGTVASGEEALQQASAQRPDLALMDVHLAGKLNGIETAAQIRAQFDIPVIYLTFYAEDVLLQQAKITEPYGYLIKPVKTRELHATIEMALYRHQSEIKLKEKQRWLDTTLRSISDAVISTDAQGRVTFMNRVAEGLTGWKQEEALGHALTQVRRIVDNDTGDPVENLAAQVIREGRVISQLTGALLVRRDGAVIPINDNAAPIRDEKGNITGAVLVFRDVTEQVRAEREMLRHRERLGELVEGRTAELTQAITQAEQLNQQLEQEIAERQRTEEALQVEKERARQYLEVAGVVLVALDNEGRITLINKRGLELLGYREAELVGQNWFETCLPEDSREQTRSIFRQLVAGEIELVEYYENPVLPKAGAERIVAWHNSILRDASGDIAGTLSSGEDITERLRAEREIRRRNRELALLNSVIATSTSTLDVEQVLQVTCRELAQAFKLPQSAAALLNTEKTEATVVAEYVAPGGVSALDKSIPVMNNPATEYVLAHKAPLAIADAQVDERMAPVHDLMRERDVFSMLIVPVMERSEVVGTIGLDSRERRKFGDEEIALAQSVAAAAGQAMETARLYQELQRRTIELTQALAQREELARLRSEFIRNVSHELRTPLAIARGHAELLESGILGELQEEQLQSVTVIVRRMQMLSRIMDDFAAIIDVEGELQRRSVDLAELLRELLAERQMREVVQQSNLTLTVEIAPDTPLVPGDAIQLRRAVSNLLDNAVKFTPYGGRVGVNLQQEGERLVLEVTDTGIGIPADQFERIFERFYQIDGSTTRRYGGTGLGLALVKEIVEVHGGQVSVQSVLGQGSTFSVALPVCPADLAPGA